MEEKEAKEADTKWAGEKQEAAVKVGGAKQCPRPKSQVPLPAKLQPQQQQQAAGQDAQQDSCCTLAGPAQGLPSGES